MSRNRNNLSVDRIVLYHGNTDPHMVPRSDYLNDCSDFGRGFYTTASRELGREWAYTSFSTGKIGYLHSFSIDLNELRILDLTKADSLIWAAVIASHRTMNIFCDSYLTAGQDRIRDFIKQ